MPAFNEQQNIYFNSTIGAYSPVTEREGKIGGDKSVTIDKYEKEVLFKIYPENVFSRGGSDQNHDKTFNLYDFATGKYEQRNLAIKHPKSKGKELRLYFRKDEGFCPQPHQIWICFIRDGEQFPFIGIVDPAVFHRIFSDQKQVAEYQQILLLDEEDDEYQKLVGAPPEEPDQNNEPQIPTKVVSKGYVRNAKIGKRAIQNANYKCEHDDSHTTFESMNSKVQFMEAHHLVPISASPDFPVNLDVQENVVSLCPMCHRGIHYGADNVRKTIIERLYEIKSTNLNKAGIEIDLATLLNIYGVKD